MTWYSPNDLPVVHCWRCGAVADVEWYDIRVLGDPSPRMIQGETTCNTPGCVDVMDGSNSTSATPPSPQEIQAAVDRAMDRFWVTFTDRPSGH